MSVNARMDGKSSPIEGKTQNYTASKQIRKKKNPTLTLFLILITRKSNWIGKQHTST